MSVPYEQLVELFMDRFSASPYYIGNTKVVCDRTDVIKRMRTLAGEERAAALEAIRRLLVIEPSLASDICFSVAWGGLHLEEIGLDFALCIELLDCLESREQHKILRNAARQLEGYHWIKNSQKVREAIEGILQNGPENIRALVVEYKLQEYLP